jgi:hypothetical protein
VLGKRGLEWRNKLLQGIASRTKTTQLRALGWSKEEIVEEEPGYYYDEEYYGFSSETWFRRNKSYADLSGAVATHEGYSAWERYGEACHARGLECITE